MAMVQRPLTIIGCGGHGRVIADIARETGVPEVGFIDDNFASAPADLGVDGPVQDKLPGLVGRHRFVVGIGDAGARRMVAELVLSLGGELATLVHPSAVIARDVRIGVGTVVMAGVVVNTGTVIGRFAVINTRASIDHDNLIEDNVQICPGCTLAGNVVCREDAFVGSGATVIPRVEVGRGAYVAAGATVIHRVRPNALVAGTPAVEKRLLA